MITNPAGFWYFLLLLPLLLLLWLRYRGGGRDLLRLAGKWRAGQVSNVFVVKWFFSGLAMVLFIVFSVLAIAGISWGQYPVSTNYSGTDVSIAVDISRSMLARDLYPSRIGRAASVLRAIVDANRGVRFDLVVFKGTAVDVVPPTQDTEALDSVLKVLGPTMLTSPGTDIQRGIRSAINSFPEQDADRHIVLLFSDGGALAGDPLEAARAAARQHIPIYVVACGTLAGASIPLENGRYVEDASGNRVITKLELGGLEAVARSSDGQLFMLSDPLVTRKIDSIIGRRSVAGSVGSYRFEIKDQFRVFVVSALLCLFVFLAARIIRWRGIV